jgi:phosphopantetheine binding protein
LPAPDARAAAAASFVAPRSEREVRIAAAWCSVLRLERASVEDNFFDLGGNSLLLLRVHGLLAPTIGAPLKVVDLFQFPTIRSLADHLDTLGRPRDAGPTDNVQEQARKRREALRRPIRTPTR